MDTKFSMKGAIEMVVRHNGQVDEVFSTYVRVLSRKRGISRQDLAQRLGIERQTVTYLYCGLIHYEEAPEYLLQAMVKEFGLTYNEFREFSRNRTNLASFPDDQPLNLAGGRIGEIQALPVVEDHEDVLDSTPSTRKSLLRRKHKGMPLNSLNHHRTQALKPSPHKTA